ncbi:uncharacterized protein LOC126561034 [Anopheles maculipalpis]|uniref:uncharacterized protein LOC126561034 n=1 Tax=Anopheles maculipalpis TaxID=1496333 RepID=UPI0021592BA0|nr:uncharacterized protein LOC126561034 [Anopheles maculipalpis]
MPASVLSIRWWRLVAICLLVLVLIELCTAQRVRRRHPHYPKFEILWPLHWVSAAYVWGFLKLGAIFAGLMLLFVFRNLSWSNSPTYIDHDTPVYHFRGFNAGMWDVKDTGTSNDEILYWTDKIEQAVAKFGEKRQ